MMNKMDEELTIDCQKCSGLCCVALCFRKIDGFPADKGDGIPCSKLKTDFSCSIHDRLEELSLKGCLSYDCIGAGQKTTWLFRDFGDWEKRPDHKKEIFEVFGRVFQLHQFLWYLKDVACIIDDEQDIRQVEELRQEISRLTRKCPAEIIEADMEEYRKRTNKWLRKILENLDEEQNKELFGHDFRGEKTEGRDFTGAFLIAANLRGCSLKGTSLLGADLRDSYLRGTDLKECLYLTQMQINSARGNKETRLPEGIRRPDSWSKQ